MEKAPDERKEDVIVSARGRRAARPPFRLMIIANNLSS